MKSKKTQSGIIDDGDAFAILIRATAFFYPLVADFGAAVDAPILVYVEDESAFQDFVEGAGGKMHEVPSTGDLPKVIRREFANEKRATYFFRLSYSRYVEENLQRLEIVSQSVSDDGVRPLIFVMATRPVQEKYFRYFSGNIFLQKMKTENLSEYQVKESELIDAAVSGQNMIHERIRKISEHDEDGSSVFTASMACLEVALEIAGVDTAFVRSFTDAAERTITIIRDQWDLSGNPDAYVEAFRNTFARQIERMDTLPAFLDRGKVSSSEIPLIGEACFYDDTNYYLSEGFFCHICASVAADVGINYVKSQLVSAGLLIANSGVRNYFTRKLEVVTVYGMVYRVRRVCLDRQKLDDEMEWGILDLIQSKKGGMSNVASGNYFGNSSRAELSGSIDRYS